jgi:hypothetical protein
MILVTDQQIIDEGRRLDANPPTNFAAPFPGGRADTRKGIAEALTAALEELDDERALRRIAEADLAHMRQVADQAAGVAWRLYRAGFEGGVGPEDVKGNRIADDPVAAVERHVTILRERTSVPRDAIELLWQVATHAPQEIVAVRVDWLYRAMNARRGETRLDADLGGGDLLADPRGISLVSIGMARSDDEESIPSMPGDERPFA